MITRRGVSAFATALLLLGTIAAQASPSAAAVDCTQNNANADLLAKVPEFIGVTLDPGAVGPGSAGPAIAHLCDVAAAEFQPSNSTIGGDHYTALKAFAATAKSGNGEDFVDAFLSGLGAGARNRTVEMDERIVQSFVTSSGDGLAYDGAHRGGLAT